MKHVITVLVENKEGVLARIVGVISGRGFNIDSLNVAPTNDPTVSRMTIQVPGDDRVLEQVTKQLNKLIDVIKVSDLTKERFIDRELIVAKVQIAAGKRSEIKELAGLVGADVISVQANTMMLQLAGDQEKIREFIELLKPYNVLDISRTGVVAMAKAEAEARNGNAAASGKAGSDGAKPGGPGERGRKS